jgi:hypothetical protein
MTPITPDPAADQDPLSLRVEGASFSVTLKALSTLLVAGLLIGSARVLQQGAWGQWSNSTQVFMALALLVILFGYAGILRSRTSVDGRCIRQTWLWHKEVRLAEITQLKLIQVPGLNWFIAPRLIVRSGALGLTTFHVADEQVLAALKKLAYG